MRCAMKFLLLAGAPRNARVWGGGLDVSYRLVMLGPPALLRDSDPMPLRSRKGQALLWYLASNPNALYSREHLQGLLWDETPADMARRDFNTMLHRLRAQLPFDCFRGDKGFLGWNPDAGVTTDVADFYLWTERAGFDPSGPVSRPLAPEEKEALYRALALWRGPFAEGFSCNSTSYDEWLSAERRRWEIRVLSIINALITSERASQQWEQVAALGWRALEIDPFQESFHRAVMEALFRQGNRSAALAQYEQCRTLLDEQLGTTPDAETTELFETIKGARIAAPSALPPSPAAAQAEEVLDEPSSRQPGEDVRGHLGSRRSEPPRLATRGQEGVTSALPPLVGRQREYSQAIGALSRAIEQGQRHMVLVTGEAGIGKTRLIMEIVDAVARGRSQDAIFPTLLLGRAYESMLNVPYAAIIDALELAVSSLDPSSFSIPDVWLRELGRLIPDVVAHRPDLSLSQPTDSREDRLRLFQAVVRFLSALPQPVLLVIDDLHWADPLTISFLDYVLRHPTDQLALAAITAVRTGDDSDSLRRALSCLEREGRLTRVTLTNLTKDDTLALVQSLSPQTDLARAQRVYSATLGHPLHTVELVAMLAQGDDPHDTNAPLRVPPTVQEVFMGRLLRLGDAAIQVADTLAVFGRDATLDQLQRTTQLSEAEVAAAVETLARACIVSDGEDGHICFQHEVFRQVLLERMSRARLTHLHRQVYAALVEESPVRPLGAEAPSLEGIDHPLLARLVTHSLEGQLWEEAFRWNRLAAAVAEKVYAFSAAVDYLESALMCLEKLPASDSLRRQQLEIYLHMAKFDMVLPPAERDARLAAAEKLAKSLGAEAYLPRIRMARAGSLIIQGRCNEATEILDTLAPLAARDPSMAVLFNAAKGAVAAAAGDAREAVAYFSRVREAVGKEVLRAGTSIYAALAPCYASMGDFAQADASLSALEEEEREQGYPFLTSKYFSVAATVAYIRGQWEKAAAHARKGIDTARATDNPYNESLSALWLGASLLELASKARVESHGEGGGGRSGLARTERRNLEEAIKTLEEALAASKKAQSYTRRDVIYAFLAMAYTRDGRLEKAEQAVKAALDLAERFGLKLGKAMCIEAQGVLAAFRGDLETARRHWHAAIQQFETLGDVVCADRCRRRLADTEHGAEPVRSR